jgi:RND family efflux transporter MFP subunit
MKRKFWKFLLPVLVIAAALAGARYLVASKPALTPAAQKERVWTVETVTAAVADVQPELRLYGEAVAGREVELRALVAGEVMRVGSNVAEGGVVRRGEEILVIDDFDYRAAADEIEAQIREAEAKLKEVIARRNATRAALGEDRKLLVLRTRELSRLESLLKKGNTSDKAVDTARMDLARQEQTTVMRENDTEAEQARVLQQRAILDRLRVALRRAQRDLDNTRLAAPFDGFLVELAAEQGKRLNVNDRVARLIDARRLEVRLTLSDSQFGRLMADGSGLRGRRARALWRVGDTVLEYDAVLDRVAARIDSASGGVDVFASLSGVGPDRPLRPGAFIEVRLKDRLYRSVVRLPEAALYDRSTVYVVENGRLSARPVTLAGHVGDDVLVQGLEGNEQVVTTQYPDIGPGHKVEVR